MKRAATMLTPHCHLPGYLLIKIDLVYSVWHSGILTEIHFTALSSYQETLADENITYPESFFVFFLFCGLTRPRKAMRLISLQEANGTNGI